MNKSFSLYLDVVRLSAAVLVYLSHTNLRWLVQDVPPASSYGHSAVVVFFVLSGFVIAYITDTRERDWTSYSASRLARVLSVVIPAIVLTPLLDSIGRQLMPHVYDYPWDHHATRLVGSLLMLNEVWFVSMMFFSNMPYWSIAVECWYYVAFGLVVFVPGRARWIAFAAVFVLLGPKLLLLAPLWWAGVLLYRWQALQRIPLALAWLLFIGSLWGIAAFHEADMIRRSATLLEGWIGAQWFTNLTVAKFFIGDYALGLLVMANFAGARVVMRAWERVPVSVERTIRWLASLTFCLYLLHQPLFLFWGSLVQGDPSGWGFWWTTTALTFTCVALITAYTESRRHLLRRWFEVQLERLRGAWEGRRAAVQR